MAALCAASLSTTACFEERATNAEFRAAMDEVVMTGEVASLQDGIVEITTNFTLADGAEAVVAEVRAFVESQIPCTEVTVPEPRTLRIDFGGLEDNCTYNGRTYAGVVTSSFEIEGNSVVVTHQYDSVTNGEATMDGSAIVTWTDSSRNVQTDFDFTVPRGMIAVNSDRTQTLLGGIGDGIQVDGARNWTGPSGDWDLDINSVQMRGSDPLPFSGSYVLTNPGGKEFTLSFSRLDEDTIQVTIAGPRREFRFNVTSSGEVDEEGEV
jgi:hypothetical protein